MADRDGWPSFTAALAAEAAGYTSRWAGLGAGLFLAGALALHLAWLGADSRLELRVAAALLLLPPYTIAGAAAGVALAATSTVRRALPEIEERLHTLVQPVMARAIESTRLGGAAMSVERFEQLVDDAIASVGMTAPGRRWSAGRLVARFVSGSALRLVRRLLVREFLERLRHQGLSQVTPAAVEGFAREKLVGLLAERIRAQVNALYGAILVASAAMVAGPILYLLARR